jgi:hypothetical protein
LSILLLSQSILWGRTLWTGLSQLLHWKTKQTHYTVFGLVAWTIAFAQQSIDLHVGVTMSMVCSNDAHSYSSSNNNKETKLQWVVVVWAWTDEATGNVIDAEIERAVIALSYQQKQRNRYNGCIGSFQSHWV